MSQEPWKVGTTGTVSALENLDETWRVNYSKSGWTPQSAYCQSMIREWENGCQKIGKQRPEDPGAQERKTAEVKPSKNGVPARTLNTGNSFQGKDSLCCPGDRCSTSLLGPWIQFCQSDPRMALGKYSPLEKEILRLGGVHTIASRKFLTYKQEEERKMLKKLQLLSSDYKQVVEYKKRQSSTCSTCWPTEAIWKARVVVPPEELKMPRRERCDVSKHKERMQLARALRSNPQLPSILRARSSSLLSTGGLGPTTTDNTWQDEGEDDDDNDDDDDTQEEREQKTTKRQEIKMNVIFKAEKNKKCFTYQPRDLKPFFPTKKVERSITGLTNRNVFPLAEFPGDLLLMNQACISRGIHPSEVTKANCLEGDSVWREYTGKPASHHY